MWYSNMAKGVCGGGGGAEEEVVGGADGRMG
jgi:hypothetical protein